MKTVTHFHNIEIESHASEGYVNLLTKGETSCIEFHFVRDLPVVSARDFKRFVERPDVSLSMDERIELLACIEAEIEATI